MCLPGWCFLQSSKNSRSSVRTICDRRSLLPLPRARLAVGAEMGTETSAQSTAGSVGVGVARARATVTAGAALALRPALPAARP